MTEESFLLDIPDFIPEYQEKINDRVNIGQLEHSIEKSIDEEYLTECVPNISLACPYCNQSLKRIGEKKRVSAVKPVVKNFEKDLKCKKNSCKGECDNYKAF